MQAFPAELLPEGALPPIPFTMSSKLSSVDPDKAAIAHDWAVGCQRSTALPPCGAVPMHFCASNALGNNVSSSAEIKAFDTIVGVRHTCKWLKEVVSLQIHGGSFRYSEN